MNEHPILFSGEMVKAILEGRKTQTRRIIKPQPTPENVDTVSIAYCRYGFPGDRLWVREKWQAQTHGGVWWHEVREHHELYNWAWTNPIKPSYDATPPRWLPSIYMPKDACRIFLEIVNIRMERVQDISHEDVIAEGGPFGNSGSSDEDFFILWNSINAKRGYSTNVNPWVWVIEFKVVML